MVVSRGAIVVAFDFTVCLRQGCDDVDRGAVPASKQQAEPGMAFLNCKGVRPYEYGVRFAIVKHMHSIRNTTTMYRDTINSIAFGY
jgi:hypothetical protein